MSQSKPFVKISEERLQERLRELKELISSNKSMPQNINELLLIRNLKYFNGNVERALKRLLANMELRQYYTNIYQHRDPFDPKLRKLIDQILMFLMPQRTANNERIMILKLIERDADKIVVDDALSVFSMVYDASLITREPDGELADSEILIVDLDGVTARHLTKLGFSSLRCFFKYMNEAHPMRISQIHLLNCPAVLDRLMTLWRPFMYASTLKAMHFHPPGSETLFECVPRALLPSELGGTGSSLEQPKWDWIKRTEDVREFLLNNEQWTTVEEENRSDTNELAAAEESLAYMGFC